MKGRIIGSGNLNSFIAFNATMEAKVILIRMVSGVQQ